MSQETQRQKVDSTVSFGEIGERLGAAIAATAEYRSFAEAHRDYRTDPQARQLLGQYQDTLRTVQLMQQLGNDTTAETRELEDLKKALDANQTLRRYFETQESLTTLLGEVNEFISERLGVDFAGLTKPRTGCC